MQAGHYYQGKLGRLTFSRLIAADVVPASTTEFMDDVSFASGIGFTDIVKRPSARAKDLRREELDHGRDLLLSKLEAVLPPLIIFTFKATAEKLLGAFPGNGFVNQKIGGSEVFVMPGPYENATSASKTLDDLKLYLN